MNYSLGNNGTPRPEVSVIIPCFNEQDTIGVLLHSIYNQTFSLEKIEVVIADGLSTDNTRPVISNFLQEYPNLDIRIVDNLKRNIPTGLNLAISASKGKYIIRLDAHSIPNSEYISKCVQALEEDLGDNVGGAWKIKPANKSLAAVSIAQAASHPLGAGNVIYRVGGEAQRVDTVPFGAFKRSLLDEIGLFDESLLTNEDYEFNTRIRQNGGTIYFDPEIWSYYVARSSFGKLAKQYWRYGYWKFRMLVRYPKSFRFRQIAGLFVLSWLILGLLSLWSEIARLVLSFEAIFYFLILLVSGTLIAYSKKDFRLLIGLPIAICIMHFAWGFGFLWSILKYSFDRIWKINTRRIKGAD